MSNAFAAGFSPIGMATRRAWTRDQSFVDQDVMFDTSHSTY
jgi:hypothetical protein